MVLTDLVEMIHAEDRQAAVAAAREAFEKRKPMRHTFRVRRADGATRMVRVAGAVSIDARGQVEAMHGVVVDKTDGHSALQAALNADSTVRRFVQAAPMPICMREQGHARDDGERELDRRTAPDRGRGSGPQCL